MIFSRGRPPSEGADEGDVLRFRFAPRDAKVWTYAIESNFPALNGQAGKFTAELPPPEKTSRGAARSEEERVRALRARLRRSAPAGQRSRRPARRRCGVMVFRRRRHSLDPADAVEALNAGRLVLFDVREGRERALRFVPGSKHLPLGQVKARLHELPRDVPVAFICETGRRSALATTTARRHGYDARNVKGGMSAWTDGAGAARMPR
jgi:rhodanese-related sulfurtransferase